MSYEPERYGAKCPVCPLREERDGPPVPNEWPDNPRALLIGEAPGGSEIAKGAPFCGKAGIELMQGLAAVGIRRSQVALSNVISCRPPENEYAKLIHQIQRENKSREREGLNLIPTPAQCCRPRLVREIAALPRIVALGGTAYHAVLGAGSIMEQRGGPREATIEVDQDGSPKIIPVRVLPTLHPSFVMRSRRWRAAFRADLGRAFRWFSSGLAWRDPDVLYAPRPAELRVFLASIRSDPFSVFDVETSAGYRDHFEPMADRLKCIGIGVARGIAAVIPFRSMEGKTYYSKSEQAEIVAILKDYLINPAWKKAGWHSRIYDTQVIQAQLGVIPTPHLDGIMVHRVAEPELPHNLGYAGSVHTDVDKWKAGHIATKSQSDKELHLYNAKDCVVTAMAIPALVKVARDRNQAHLIPVFQRLQDVCVGLHQNGMPVDQKKRREWDLRLLRQADAKRKLIRELSGNSSLNPASFPQIASLLFERSNIAPHHYTELGDPSTDDDALRAFLSDTWGLDPKRRALVTAIRDFRRVAKRRGVVVRLRPISEDVITADDLADYTEDGESRDQKAERLELEFARKKKGKARAPGLVLPDGRVHADYNSHGTVGWRMSSSNPNMQNFDPKLRDIFVAPLGFVFVGCDEAQLELRMVAGLAGAQYYIDAFKANADPHRNLCIDVFGDRFLNASPDHQKKLRVCVKQLTYGCAAKGTRIVTLGPEGAKPIEELEPGLDWTWTWDGKKYSPTKIMNKWSRGTRKCVRVTFEWSKGAAEVLRDSAVFTVEHRFILRDGLDCAAGDLRPGDSLMPFGRWRSGPYRMIDLFNDGGRYGEHRAVMDLEVGDPRMVHHQDENGCNNRPDNLLIVTAKEHAIHHWDDERRELQRKANKEIWGDHDVMNAKLTAGRLASSMWRAVNRKNYMKMRAGLDKARSEGRGTARGQLRPSKLDAFRGRMGILSDADLARMIGVTPQAIYAYRKKRGIPSPPKPNHTVISVEPAGEFEVWDIEVDHPSHNFAIEAGIFVHNSLYAAEDKTKQEIITSAEDEDETLMFPDFTMREISAFSQAWFHRVPEIPDWWDRVVADWRRDHFLAEPIMGLKCDFLDGEELNKLVNYQAQSGGAGLVHLATFRFLEQIPFFKWGRGTGLVQQGHDALVALIPADHGPWKIDEKGRETWCAPDCTCRASKVARFMEECMAEDGRKYGMDVSFAGEAKIGRTWKAV